MRKGKPGEVYNVGGGNHTTVNQVITVMQEIMGKKARIKRIVSQKGDVRDTQAQPDKSRQGLGFNPHVRLEPGLRRQIDWVQRALLK
jgi:nucleoside-diphosphate-sugar epimerase